MFEAVWCWGSCTKGGHMRKQVRAWHLVHLTLGWVFEAVWCWGSCTKVGYLHKQVRAGHNTYGQRV